MGPSHYTQVIRTAIPITGTVTLTTVTRTTATVGTTMVSRGRFTALSASTVSVVVISIISTFSVISRPRLTAADSGQVGLAGGQVGLAGGQVGLPAGQVGLAGGQAASLATSAPSNIPASADVQFLSQATAAASERAEASPGGAWDAAAEFTARHRRRGPAA